MTNKSLGGMYNKNPYPRIRINPRYSKRVFAHFDVDRLSMFAFLFPFDWFIWCLRRFAFVTATLRKAPFKELLDILKKGIKERKELRIRLRR